MKYLPLATVRSIGESIWPIRHQVMDDGFQTAAFSQIFADKSSTGRSSDVEYGTELGSGLVFSADFHKFDDLKNMLECNKDALKLDAMRRIIGIRKLVFAYLTRYAEEQQDVALLSVSTFQRSLKDPNPLIRASALRVLSSIRIPMLLPIVMLAIQDACKDLSPFVRKVAAHAILKVYSLDPEEKDRLIELLERLLADKTTLVIGSAIRVFEELCPDRLDLIHPHYRKICSLLMDVDEWGQVIILNVLTRYARTQFLNPAKLPPIQVSSAVNGQIEAIKTSDLIELESCTDVATDGETTKGTGTDGKELQPYSMEDAIPILQADYALLVNSCRFLLQSRTTAVVVAVAQLLFALEAKEHFPGVAKALIRCLRGSREVQYVVLCNIATLSMVHRGLFEPFQRSFYVFADDPLQVKLIKLEILTNLVTEATSSTILHEFQHYVNSSDQEFVISTIQAIGRCASSIPQIADICLGGLVRLMSRPDEKVVAECVVILRKLLQIQNADHKDLIIRIAELTDTMTVPSALASILWLLGEYSHRVPRIAPDVLRKMAKMFPTLESVVKLQVLNLAAKLCIVNPRQTHLLAQYVFNLARYDQNYDIRDRSRLLRALLFPQSLIEVAAGDSSNKLVDLGNGEASPVKEPVLGYLAKHARKICLAAKPAPLIQSSFQDRSNFRLGSLSHLLNRHQSRYRDLPDWPVIPPDPWSRVVKPTPDGTSAANSELHSPTSAIGTSASVGKSGNLVSYDDFFSESEDSTTEEDANGLADDLVDEKIKDSEDLLDDEDEDGSDIDADQHEEMLSDLGAEELHSSSSDSDLDFVAILKKQSAAQRKETVSVSTVDESKLTRTTEASSSEEQSFSSSDVKLRQSNSPGEPSPFTETTEGEEDEELDDLFDFSALKKNKINLVQQSGHKHAVSHPTGDATVVQQLEDHEDTSARFSETSSATVPVVCDSAMSSDQNAPSSYPPSPSVALDPGLCPEPVNLTPTPLPTVNPELFASSVIDTPCGTVIDQSRYVGIFNPLSLLSATTPDSLRWIEIQNLHHPCFRLTYQYNRTVWEHLPNLVIICLRLANQDEHVTIHDIHLDLRSTAIGRLLLDARRIEPFDKIEELPPGAEHACTCGIDFAGFTDPVELHLVYHTSQSSNGQLVRWPISIAPPAGELLRSFSLDESSFFLKKDNLLATKSLDQFCAKLTGLRTTPDHLTHLARTVLSSANVSYCFFKLHRELSTPFSCRTRSAPPDRATAQMSQLITIYFSGETISDSQCCLIEMSIELDDSTTTMVAAPSPGGFSQTLQSTQREVLVTVLCSDSRFRSALSNTLNEALNEPPPDPLVFD
ncbi:AP-3 complex subunit beta-2 [Clonorchis sinensis]|uniref:AP-3 complex subunit beta-2 n=1 Tax=Clonorchis sinensis TaxID=79923 RepID=G7Y2F3_CLOSI|nr:AP-3 complex subunit beta-2 [Clonorchis sinensis]